MKWSQELRVILYRRLLEKYGPHKTWESRNYPRAGEHAEFRAFMEEIADSLRKITGTNFKDGGPIMQFAHAITTQPEARGTGRAYNIIMNKAAAYDVGFITSKEMPSCMLMEYENNIWMKEDK